MANARGLHHVLSFVIAIGLIGAFVRPSTGLAGAYPQPRATIPGGIRIGADGPQIHPSCRNFRSIDEDSLQFIFEGISERLDTCAKDYPLFSGYLAEAKNLLKRLVITCRDHARFSRLELVVPSGDPSKANAFVTIPKEIMKGIEIADPARPIASKDPVIIFQSTYLSLSNFREELFSRLIRMTSANDWGPGNPPPVKGCQDGQGLRRTEFIIAACESSSRRRSGVEVPAETLDVIRPTVSVFENPFTELKISECRTSPEQSLEYGCVRPLIAKNADPVMAIFFPSKGLPEEKVRPFCERFFDRQFCTRRQYHLRPEDIRKTPALAPVLAELKQRMDALTPKTAERIPVALLEVFPELAGAIRQNQDLPCLKENMSLDQDGTLVLKKVSWRPNSSAPTLSGSLGDLASALNLGSCEQVLRKRKISENERSRVLKVLNTLRYWGNEVGILAQSAANDRPFLFPFTEWDSPIPDDLQRASGSLKQLLGEDLFNRYSKAVQLTDPNSEEFDCISAGLAPFTTARMTAEKAAAALKAVKLSTPGPACKSQGAQP